MARNLSILVLVFSLILLVLSQCNSQVTFSRNWEASGGKRSGHGVVPVPDIYFKLSANSICRYLLSEIKQLASCETQTDEDSPSFTTN